MENTAEEYTVRTNTRTGVSIKFKVSPVSFPGISEWTILGNLELENGDLIGDKYFNVVAHKVDKKGIHHWAIGWEYPFAGTRDLPGYGFEDGYYLRSVEYIPVSYLIGPLVGEEYHKTRWRFRGQKTWLPMESDMTIREVQEKLRLRTLSHSLSHEYFNLLAVGWFGSKTNTLCVSQDIPQNHLTRLTDAAKVLVEPGSLRIYMLPAEDRSAIYQTDILLLLFDTDPNNLVAINVNSKPRHMAWGKFIDIARLTGVWPVTAESIVEGVFPIRVINIQTNSVSTL